MYVPLLSAVLIDLYCVVHEIHEVNLTVQKKEPFKKKTFSSEDMASDRDTESCGPHFYKINICCGSR